MIPDEAKDILTSLRKIEWLAFMQEKYIRHKFINYLEITFVDDLITGEVLRSLSAVSEIHGVQFHIFHDGKKIKARFQFG